MAYFRPPLFQRLVKLRFWQTPRRPGRLPPCLALPPADLGQQQLHPTVGACDAARAQLHRQTIAVAIEQHWVITNRFEVALIQALCCWWP
jgi:hypothetical protein